MVTTTRAHNHTCVHIAPRPHVMLTRTPNGYVGARMASRMAGGAFDTGPVDCGGWFL
ncbi:stress protein [Anopheles sinensis]|uniref:Stress protein n=1 Tax=Anopheles sinensis TaxID=74873 RepID=A0A084VV23_ANOSI|nr:stress protein [Anopheles sinensis]